MLVVINRTSLIAPGRPIRRAPVKREGWCRMKRTACLATVGTLMVAAFGLFAGEARAAPLNDDFAAAQLLEGEFGNAPATNKKASKEAGEPNHADNAGGRSIWFHWVAQRDGTLSVWTTKTSFDTLLAVYTGSAVNALTEVASNDDFGVSTNSRVTFAAVSGTEYFIAVDGFDGENGPFLLRWRQGPDNDDFANAEPLAGDAGTATGTAFGATLETDEPAVEGSATAWYRWTASGNRTFGFAVSEEARGVFVYTGASVDALTLVDSGREVRFTAAAGTEYFVAVAGWRPGLQGEFTLYWGEPPPNDDFGDARRIRHRSGTVAGSLFLANRQQGEPRVAASDSVWYRWRAPRTGYVRFETAAIKFDPVLTIYRGNSVDELHRVARNDDFDRFDAGLSFRAIEGRRYFVSVVSFGTILGKFELRWFPGRIAFGTREDDVIIGTSGRDYLVGRGGNDVIRGKGGRDFLDGGSGSDVLYGDDGNDLLRSRDFVRGNDVVHGGAGTDTVRRDSGDRIFGIP